MQKSLYAEMFIPTGSKTWSLFKRTIYDTHQFCYALAIGPYRDDASFRLNSEQRK